MGYSGVCRLTNTPDPSSSAGVVVVVLIIIFLLLGGGCYLGYRKKKYGVFLRAS
jgi:LPXTG-motif cell wall-anchored protein